MTDQPVQMPLWVLEALRNTSLFPNLRSPSPVPFRVHGPNERLTQKMVAVLEEQKLATVVFRAEYTIFLQPTPLLMLLFACAQRNGRLEYDGTVIGRITHEAP